MTALHGPRLARPAIALLVALALAAGPVAAAPATNAAPASARDAVLVLPIAVGGVSDGHLARSLEERVASGLRRGGFTPVDADIVRARVPAGACDAACLKGAVAGTGARWAVRADVAVEGRDYSVRLVLLDPGTGAAVVTRDETCEICGHEELGERVGDLASGLQRELAATATPPPRLRVLTRPEGSTVTVDGATVGVTPIDLAVDAGEHDIVIERPGFIAHRRRIVAADGRTETIADELGAIPPPPSTAAPRRRLAPIGWAALGAGLAAVVGGAVLVAVDERPIKRDCSGENVDVEGHCKWRRDTLAGGATLLTLGVAALVAGAVVLVLDRRRAPAAPRRAQVRPHAGGLLVRF